jgi:hypothetical protein
MLAEHGHAVGFRLFFGLQKTYCTKHIELRVTESLLILRNLPVENLCKKFEEDALFYTGVK